jgi:hypothetical protein
VVVTKHGVIQIITSFRKGWWGMYLRMLGGVGVSNFVGTCRFACRRSIQNCPGYLLSGRENMLKLPLAKHTKDSCMVELHA